MAEFLIILSQVAVAALNFTDPDVLVMVLVIILVTLVVLILIGKKLGQGAGDGTTPVSGTGS
jgi:Na+-driven multidrug efflux pump